VNAVGPSRAALFVNLQPLLGVGLAWLLVGEAITRWQLIGGAFVLGGVALATSPRGLPSEADGMGSGPARRT
jgi:drug/metabolite transporter (DMT)-like permease